MGLGVAAGSKVGVAVGAEVSGAVAAGEAPQAYRVRVITKARMIVISFFMVVSFLF